METAELIVNAGSKAHEAAAAAMASGAKVITPISGTDFWTVESIERSGTRAIIKLKRSDVRNP